MERLNETGIDHTARTHGASLSVAYSSDGNTLASASSDRTVKLWDVSRDHEPDVLVEHEGIAFVVAISPDGKTIASSATRGVLTLWDVDTRSKLKTHRFPGTRSGVSRLHPMAKRWPSQPMTVSSCGMFPVRGRRQMVLEDRGTSSV